MHRQPHYSRAPITEALIDFRVELPLDVSISRLEHLQDRLQSEYPTNKKTFSQTFEFTAGNAVQQVATPVQQVGVRLETADGTRVLQAGLQGFTFSRLPQYDTWEAFSSEARSLWAVYAETCKPTSIKRVAVRYINRIDIPHDRADPGGTIRLEDFVRFGPEIPDELPHNVMNGFITRVLIPQPDIESMLVVNETLAQPAQPGVLSIVLDFDLFREGAWDPDTDAVWQFLEQLRDRKNEVFEASITDRTRRLID